MSTASVDVVPIFATPFGVVTMPDAPQLNSALQVLFTARAAERRDARGAGGTRVFSSRDDLGEWPDEPVRSLIGEMLRGVSSVAAATSDLDSAQFAALRIQVRAWFTVVSADGCVPSTSYPNTSWMAIYCVAAPPPAAERFDSGVLRMHESRLGNMFQDPASTAARIPYRAGHYMWRPVAGQMAVFPGSITHEIALLRSSAALVLVNARVRFVGSGDSWMPPW
ncbi:MAG: hypothetical protein JO184_13455 [Gammaproteobacteria bacterium]|nr:hypothetical protein [Gammaproteobacteria bacterium]